ncbi:MAG: iron complex transport system substrate-binding protein [Clostridiales bacterium]|jgi:iron complex transport system substrate-binding protein|nr:iron complex transport system substrate-binding protein [Clostridiales bacterium]
MKKIWILALVLVMVIGMTTTGCTSTSAGENTATTTEAVTETTAAETTTEAEAATTFIFTDDLGREVELPVSIERVAPSGSLATIILYAIAPDKLVSIARQPDEAYQKYYPASYLSLPSTGQIYGKQDINLEELINLQPQVIIDLGDIKEDMAADMDAYQEQVGIPIIFIEATTATYPEAFKKLGTLLGEEAQGEAMAEFTEETMARAAAASAQITDENRLSVMFGTGESGLNCNAKGSIHCTVLEAVGVDNAIVVPEVSNKGGGNTVTMEEVISADPDVILLDVGGPYATLTEDSYWSGLRAVKDGNYYEIPSGPYNFLSNPPSINQIIGIDWLGNLLYPDLYDIDIAARIQAFYKLFWHYDLSDEEVNQLLANSTFRE